MEDIKASNIHPLAKKRSIIIGAVGIGIVIASIISIMIGQVSFNLSDIWNGIFHNEDTLSRRIVCVLCLPRVLIGLIVGLCLASSGAILQGVMRNPLADSGIIGVSSGGGVVAIVIMIVFAAYIALSPLAAFVGALITDLSIYSLSWKGGTSPVRIILVGVAINAVIGACMSALM